MVRGAAVEVKKENDIFRCLYLTAVTFRKALIFSCVRHVFSVGRPCVRWLTTIKDIRGLRKVRPHHFMQSKSAKLEAYDMKKIEEL